MESGEMRQRLTLKEKLKNHYRENPPSFKPDPKEGGKFGVTYFVFTVLSMTLEAVFILIPANYEGQFYSIITLEVLSIFIFAEIIVNWYRTYYDVANYVRTSTKDKYFSNGETPPEWKKCLICQVDAPPRAYHCVVCNKCILKRDHHCFFTSSCIGFQNQKYFIMFCFYSVAGASFALFLQLSYMNEIFPLSGSGIISYIPVVALKEYFIGTISFSVFLLILHMYIIFFTGFICAMYGLWQMLLVICGKTNYEAKKSIRKYNRGVLDNLRSVFGHLRFSLVLFLAPMSLPQLGDGIKWETNPMSVKNN